MRVLFLILALAALAGCATEPVAATVPTDMPATATQTPAQARVTADIQTLSELCTESVHTLAQETLWAQQQAIAQGVAAPDVDFIVSDVTHMAQAAPGGRQDCLPWFRQYVALAKLLNPPAR